MKTLTSFTVLFIFLLFLSSCNDDSDCPEDNTGSISQYELNKLIVETNTRNVTTGFQSVFSESIPDSTNRAKFSQDFVNGALFWEDKSGYFFVETIPDAWCVAHINPELIGTQRLNVKDENGKYFIKEIVEVVQYSGYGYVEYYRKNPATGGTDRKLSFVTSIPAAQWFIGTGFYGDPPEKYYSVTDAGKTVIKEITTTLAGGFGKLFDGFYDSNESREEFCRLFIDHIKFYDDGSGYFFVNNFDGINIAHGADPSHEGQNDYDLQDQDGKYIIRDMINIAENQGSDYYEYKWINPKTGNVEKKIVYVSRIGDYDYFIASGIYVE